MTRLSLVCRAAQGRPSAQHQPCTGCDCACHHVPAPADLRQQVEQARADRQEAAR